MIMTPSLSPSALQITVLTERPLDYNIYTQHLGDKTYAGVCVCVRVYIYIYSIHTRTSYKCVCAGECVHEPG